jgi:hypothetical protein
MKTLILSALAASTVFVGAASAAGVRLNSEVIRIVPAAAEAQLTDSEIHALNSVVNSDDSYNAKRAVILTFVQ